MNIATRDEWDARPPRQRYQLTMPSPELWLHHTADDVHHGPAGVRWYQDFHMDTKGWFDIAYSFLVDDQDQTVYEGRGAGIVGGHTEDHNSRSHAICVIGNFQTRAPQPATIGTIANLIRFGHESGWWPAQLSGGHRDAYLNDGNPPGTLCPGQYLYDLIPTINHLATFEDDTMFVLKTDPDTRSKAWKVEYWQRRFIDLDSTLADLWDPTKGGTGWGVFDDTFVAAIQRFGTPASGSGIGPGEAHRIEGRWTVAVTPVGDLSEVAHQITAIRNDVEAVGDIAEDARNEASAARATAQHNSQTLSKVKAVL